MLGVTMDRICLNTVGGAVVLLMGAAWVSAHEGVDELAEQLTRQIAQRPDDVALYIRRGDLMRDHGHWDAALADFERAAAREPDHPQLDYLRARTLQEAGWFQAALVLIDRHLLRFADDGPAHLVRARALTGGKDYLEAAPVYRNALERLERPQPDHYLECADALTAAGDDHVAEAVQCLDQGIERLGPIVTLQRRAIELEARLGRYDQALRRIDAVMNTMHRKETWLAFRGRILDQADRPDEARAAYEASRVAIESLADRHRKVALTQALEEQVRSALARLDAQRGGAASHTVDLNLGKERE
jgi:tetratricopeptide (TPR) repeat protein